MIASRPLTIAYIFDRTVTIIVQRWRAVFALSVIYATPTALVTASVRGKDQTGPVIALEMSVALLVGALTFSPFVRLAGDPDAPNDVVMLLRRAARDFGRSLGSLVLLSVALAVVLAVAGTIVFAATLGLRFYAGASASLIGSVVAALLLLTLMALFFVMSSVAYANVILERVGPWRGLTSAVSRVGTKGLPRTWMLGAALLVVSFVPVLAIDAALRALTTSTGMWWLLVPEAYLTAPTGVAFGTVASAFAAVDYRNRCEGADLHAVLDAPPPAS